MQIKTIYFMYKDISLILVLLIDFYFCILWLLKRNYHLQLANIFAFLFMNLFSITHNSLHYYYTMYGVYNYKIVISTGLTSLYECLWAQRKIIQTNMLFKFFIQFNKQILMQRYKDLSFHTEKYSKDNGI